MTNGDSAGLEVVSSGVDGLDELLHGGYIVGRLYLVRGSPGTGKSLLGQHFLEEGLQNGDEVVYIHGEETIQNIKDNANELDIDLDGANFLDLGPETDFFVEDISYDLVDPADIESERFTDDIKDAIEGYDPDRIFLDPITQLRHVESDNFQFRKRLLSLMRFLRERETTVVTSRTRSDKYVDEDIESLSDGIIDLHRSEGGRRIEVPKHRGFGQQPGSHGIEIRHEGIEVYPQLIPKQIERSFNPELISSGLPELDALLGGGIEKGSVTFISGPSGVGKTTAGTQLATAAANRGQKSILYLFEEMEEEFIYRSEALGYPITELQDEGTLIIREIEPLLKSAEEVAQMIQADIDHNDPTIAMVDGISGYKTSLQGDSARLTNRLHALTRTMKRQGIAVLLLDEKSAITGIPSATSENTSYLADNVILMSYLEQKGGLEHTIGVLKKRLGRFEKQFREFSITSGSGLEVGEPLKERQGILRGEPAHDE